MKVISTTGGSIYIFKNWNEFTKYYGRSFNANSGMVIILPRMNTAG